MKDEGRRLKVAAPELLEALTVLLEMHDNAVFIHGEDDAQIVANAIGSARAAIEKAGGKL